MNSDVNFSNSVVMKKIYHPNAMDLKFTKVSKWKKSLEYFIFQEIKKSQMHSVGCGRSFPGSNFILIQPLKLNFILIRSWNNFIHYPIVESHPNRAHFKRNTSQSDKEYQ